MTNPPLAADPGRAAWFARAFDQEGKIVRALAELGPIADRDVAAWGVLPTWLADRLSMAGARIVPDGSVAPVDVVLGAWSAFRGVEPTEIADAQRLVRPGGRLLALHDYGRDDIARLTGDRPEYSLWSRRDGPFTAAGFKIRVIHCWWTFAAIDEAGEFLAETFGPAGEEVAATLRRPRLAHNIAVYHRGP